MIVVQVTEPRLRQAVCHAAHPEEDAIVDTRLVAEAIDWGLPRLVVRSEGHRSGDLPPGLAVLVIDRTLVHGWEADRRSLELPSTRLSYLTQRCALLMRRTNAERSWVDHTLAELAKASGSPLPPPLRSFARRVLEFPSHYTDLHAVADASGTSRGALKARFRRRGLPSPHSYLQWFRILRVAHDLSDRSNTIAGATRRLGFTSNGNLCRTMLGVSGMTPTEGRTRSGWQGLLIGFARSHLMAPELRAWGSLDGLFTRLVA
jgi:AraC-like DNA-binding protein